MICGGKVISDAALLLLFHTDLPFAPFKCDYFEPTSHKMVVTDADTEVRIVRELNAEPAATEYARQVGVIESKPGALLVRLASGAGGRGRAILRALDPEGESRRLALLLLRHR